MLQLPYQKKMLLSNIQDTNPIRSISVLGFADYCSSKEWCVVMGGAYCQGFLFPKLAAPWDSVSV